MPIPVLNASQAAEWDERARTADRIPSRVLMEAAGRAVAQLLALEYPAALHSVTIVEGKRGACSCSRAERPSPF